MKYGWDGFHTSLDLSEVYVKFPRKVVTDPDIVYKCSLELRITPKKESLGDFPVFMSVYSKAGIITLELTKQQAMMLADFLQLANHIKEE